MAEAVGTALGALGVVGLLTVCLDCFDFIQNGLSLGNDFVLLEGQFSGLRIRLFAWGKACGFMSVRGYDRRLDHPAWKQHVQKQLNGISLLFLGAAKIVKKYDLRERYEHNADGPLSQNAQFIDEGLQDFLKRIRKTKKRAGFLGALTWALKDKKEFTELLQRLKECIEALELVTRDLNLFEDQRQIVEYEIQSISEPSMLEGMINSESKTTSVDIISDAASQRLLQIRETSIPERSSSLAASSKQETFFTAPSHVEHQQLLRATTEKDGSEALDLINLFPSMSLSGSFEEQQLRIMKTLISENPHREQDKPFELDETGWGLHIDKLLKTDCSESAGLISKCQKMPKGCLRRITRDVMGVVTGKEKFMTARFIDDDLRLVRATIEGPPQSPYRGGIFHLVVTHPENYPARPMVVRFLTKIYHPNINSEGRVCIDTLECCWSPVHSLQSVLVSIISMISEPGVEDPLVPEIAATYIQDREQYDKNAMAYTQKYAGPSQSYPEFGVTPIL